MAVVFNTAGTVNRISSPVANRLQPGRFQFRKSRFDEIVGVVSRIRHQWDEVKLISLEDGTDVKVPDPSNEISENSTYRFNGRWKQHPKYGKQFQADSFSADTPISQRGIIAYLAQECDHVGTATARKIWDQFGAQSIDIVRDQPDKLVDAGILDSTQALEASECLRNQPDVNQTKIDLLGLFKGYGFGQKCITACIETWGAKAAATVRRDPFKMMVAGLPGASYLRCDRLYNELGLPPRRLKRQMLKAWYAIHSDTSGHTWFSMDVVRDVDPKAARLALRSRWLVTEKDEYGRTWITERHKAAAERDIANNIMRLNSWRPSVGNQARTLWPDVSLLEGISDHQREESGKALQSPVAVLAGSPGTGKTFTAAAIIRAIKKMSGGAARIYACAPTGKAAVRLQESLQKVTGIAIEAKTIHSMIGLAGGDDEEPTDYNQEYKVEGYLFVDETSMVTTPLMAKLLASCRGGTHILFLGDPYQLPPVGHGAPLRDMLRADRLCTAELTEIQRNAGRIVQACKAIKEGRRFEVSAKYNAAAGENLRFIESIDSDDTVAGVLNLHDIVPNVGFDPVWQTQVLVAVNTRGKCCRVLLNKHLQKKLNPNGFSLPGHPFRVGDKIICLKNNRSKLVALKRTGYEAGADGQIAKHKATNYIDTPVETTSGGVQVEAYIANGEIGKVLAIGLNQTIALFDAPKRLVRILHGSGETDANEKKSDNSGIRNSDEQQPLLLDMGKEEKEEAEEESSAAQYYDLGYAITTHKSQGSECPCVIVVIDPLGRSICTREHLYTSISRAKDLCLLVGQRRVADEFCRRIALGKRKTFLVERLRDQFSETTTTTQAGE